MAHAVIGKISNFDQGVESWESYSERLDQFFVANDIKENNQVATLLSLVGPRTYDLLKNLCAPELPKEKDFKTLSDLLSKHFNPKPLVIAERFQFHKRDMKVGETVLQYIAELRKLASYCKFDANLNDSLRDRFVCGLRYENIQKRLLSESELTLDKAIELAIAMETAASDASDIEPNRL